WQDFAIYHYAFYERAVFDRLTLRHGASPELAAKFHGAAIDLHQRTIDAVVLPLYFYTLKDVAKYAGYTWSDPEAGGAESVVWYDSWLKSKDPVWLQRLRQYNEDDVRATMLLKDWLSGLKPHKKKDRTEELPPET
ncbi:MAG TPA: TM0106 family RecB-like putative nuclease, partial [Candidatus Paceibacterota bacterium]|nr:TM0106 family RecB-like putative nuclease [Candidatus Paceibacterota bacterium]